MGKRDVFIASSSRYGDIRKGQLEGAAWEAARPNYCRTVGILANGEKQVTLLTQQLDEVYRRVIEDMPQNKALRFENGEMVFSPLDKLEEPESLLALREEIAALMPSVHIPEMLLEINALTGFASEFTHVSEMEARAAHIEVSICGVLVAEAMPYLSFPFHCYSYPYIWK